MLKKGKTTTTKKTKLLIGKKELLFNIISLIFLIIIGLYFGIRSFYFYGQQNKRIKEENQTLNGTILKLNQIEKENDGLHQDKDGYYFKGNVVNNYVKFANRLFRVIRINNDNTVKIISEDVPASFMWGSDVNYETSNLKEWLEKGSTPNSGIYYKTLPSPEKFLVKTKYSEDILKDSKVKTNSKNNTSYITTLTIKDYINASGKNSYLNIGKAFWTLGLDENNNNLFVDTDGSINDSMTDEIYGIRAVLTLNKNLNIISGDGTKENPFVINQDNNINYVDSYINIAGDIWKVNYDDNHTLKLYLNNPNNITLPYSYSTSIYNLYDKNNIAYYLNNNLFNSLTYNQYLNNCNFYTGEISSETAYQYSSIYVNYLTTKVGLLNIFDYYTGSTDDFYYMTTTSSVGSMAYVYHQTGLVEEVKVETPKNIVPVISINKNLIKGGLGTLDNPYIV